jgi:putative membrane protein
MIGRAAAASTVRDHPLAVTAVLTVLGYTAVLAAFADLLPVPALERRTVLLLGHLIAVINTGALLSLVAGWRFVKRGEIRRHAAAMLSAFALILLFLVLYVWKQAGGFTKELQVSQGQFLAEYAGAVTYGYLLLLGIHVVLSILAVPLVLYAVLIGTTHTPQAVPETRHPTVGRVAVAVWAVSLVLGIVTYFLLNHVYGWTAAGLG